VVFNNQNVSIIQFGKRGLSHLTDY
jgi:hypothetical protein